MRGLVLGLVLGVVGVAGWAVVSGFLAGLSAGPPLPSADQTRIIATYGAPARWVVADGPSDPGAPPLRLERWIYPDAGVMVDFIDGFAGEVVEITPSDPVPVSWTPISPVELDRSMDQDDVEAVLDGPGELLDPVESELGELTTWAHWDVGLVVQYLDGRFYSAQTT